jgi:hypothetical protein
VVVMKELTKFSISHLAIVILPEVELNKTSFKIEGNCGVKSSSFHYRRKLTKAYLYQRLETLFCKEHQDGKGDVQMQQPPKRKSFHPWLDPSHLQIESVGVLTNTSNKKRNEKVLYDGRYKYIL